VMDMERVSTGAVLFYCTVFSTDMEGKTEENHDSLRIKGLRPEIRSRTFRTRNSSDDYSVTTFAYLFRLRIVVSFKNVHVYFFNREKQRTAALSTYV
jgi:hypothetical protein